jgi:deoxyribonucleoside regulator
LARSLGIVTIIVTPPQFFDQTWLEKQICEKYKVRRVLIGIPEDHSDDAAHRAIGSIFQEKCDSIIGGKTSIGIGWGSTINQMINNLKGTHAESEATVLPLLGGFGQSMQAYQVNTLVDRLASWLNAKRLYLMAPALFDDPSQKAAFSTSSAAAAVIKQWDTLQAAIFSLGRPIGESEVLNSAFPKEYILDLIKHRGIGDLLARFFNAEGDLVCGEIEDHLLGISFKQLLKVPERICLAGGEKKLLGMKTALRAGFITTLVTDLYTAQSLISSDRKADKEEPPKPRA